MKITWGPAGQPLDAVAVGGQGSVGDELVRRANTSISDWKVWRFESWTIVVADDLPWIDGVVYLGVLPDAPSVLVPVHRRPEVPADLLARAVRSLVGQPNVTVALLPDGDGDRVSVLALEPA